MRKGDILVIAAILLLTGAIAMFFFSSEKGGSATVSIDGKQVQTIDLSGEAKNYTFLDGDIVLRVENGKIRFLEAHCPDLVCVHTGWLSIPGRVAACVPNRVIVQVEGKLDDEVDVVLY